jgi:two-component system cell cycle sensor histidine kinase/response regulator CckA
MNTKPTSEPAVPRARILIVDDERHNRQLLEVMLAPERFVLETASSGEEALATVARLPPDLILLDIMMPGMDGYEVARIIKTNPMTKSIPIVMVTAMDDRKAMLLGLSAGAEDFLSKPVDRAELTMRVRNLLRLKTLTDGQERYSRMLEAEVGLRTIDLVESERLYRSTFDGAPVGIVHVGLDGRWLRVNQRLCDLLGYTAEELQSASGKEIILSEQVGEEAESFLRLAEGTLDRCKIDEKQYRRRDGTLVWARVNVSVHRDSEGQAAHFIKVIEDITERRLLEAQMRQASKMDAVGQLASGVAHDFNNLLSVILSYSEMLAGDLKESDPMRADLNEIRNAGLRAVALTRQLLAFSRQQVLQPKVVNLTEVVGGLENMLRRLIGEDVQLVAIGNTGLGKILVDPGQMEQVIVNLAVNARDAMPQGGKLTMETGEVVLDENYASEHVGVKAGRHVMLAVSDTGVGMDKATQARMFEPFFTTKESGKGTGLGLATVFGIVRQSEGTICVDSEPGKGTTFKIYFPAASGDVVPRTSANPSDHHSVRGSETILVVEDEERVRVLACTILRKYGYHVLEAQNGGEALLLCEQHAGTIHLLLTDVVMPLMSGKQVAERLLTVRPTLKVLYMTGYTNDAVVRHGILDSTISFVQKPITPETLARKVRETLDSADLAVKSPTSRCTPTEAHARILIVDDDVEVQRLVKRAAEAEGFVVTQAFDGAPGLAHAVKETFDLILLDINMPTMDGRDVLSSLKRNPATAGVPVIAYSGRAGQDDRLALLQLGAEDIIEKPFQVGLLMQKIQHVIRKAHERAMQG